MIVLLLLGKIALLPKIATKNLKNILAQIWTILVSNYTVFIKSVHAILPKSRRMIIDYQLNKLLENCLKTQLVGFGWADVLGLSPSAQCLIWSYVYKLHHTESTIRNSLNHNILY